MSCYSCYYDQIGRLSSFLDHFTGVELLAVINLVCRVFSLFENVPVRRQSRADTRNFFKGQSSVDFILFAMCALSHNAPCLPPLPLPLQKKQIAKTLASIVFNFPRTTGFMRRIYESFRAIFLSFFCQGFKFNCQQLRIFTFKLR